MKKLILFAGILIICSSCRELSEQKPPIQNLAKATIANGFRYKSYAKHTLLDIVNPWDTTRHLARFVLVKRGQVSDEIKNLQREIIEVPITSAVISNTAQAENMLRLGGLEQIVGAFDATYLLHKEIKARIQQQKISDLGPSSHINQEQIIALRPNVIFTSPYENQKAQKTKLINTHLLPYLDYMEDSPLGQVEWIKVIGLLLDQSVRADSLFEVTKTRYNQLKGLSSTSKNLPSVFSEIKTGSSWYISGGESYIAQMYKDAGANYIFSELTHSGAKPFAEEWVFSQAQKADFWLIKHHQNNLKDLKDLEQIDPIYAAFDAFNKEQVFLCNTSQKTYYEEISLYPDRLLSDLIAIFHPDLLPNHQFYYFQQLQHPQ